MKRTTNLFIALAASGLLCGYGAFGQQPAGDDAPAGDGDMPAYTDTEAPEPRGLPESTPRGSGQAYPSLEEINAAAQAEAQAQAEGGAPGRIDSGGGGLLQAAMALAVVVAAILLLYAFLRRLGSHNPLVSAGGGQILGRTYLAPKASLHFVRVGERVLVVGVTPQQVNLVSEMDAALLEAAVEPQPTPFAPRPPSARSFGSVFKRLWDRLPSPSPEPQSSEPAPHPAARSEEPEWPPSQERASRQGAERNSAGDDLASLQLELRRLQRRIEETRHAGSD